MEILLKLTEGLVIGAAVFVVYALLQGLKELRK